MLPLRPIQSPVLFWPTSNSTVPRLQSEETRGDDEADTSLTSPFQPRRAVAPSSSPGLSIGPDSRDAAYPRPQQNFVLDDAGCRAGEGVLHSAGSAAAARRVPIGESGATGSGDRSCRSNHRAECRSNLAMRASAATSANGIAREEKLNLSGGRPKLLGARGCLRSRAELGRMLSAGLPAVCFPALRVSACACSCGRPG